MTHVFPTDYASILSRIDAINPITYSHTRNHLSGNVTKLSAYITRGAITLPFIKEMVLKKYSQRDAKKFIQELAWREYFQQVWSVKGDEIFNDLRFKQKHVITTDSISAITKGITGIEIIDEHIHDLLNSGYMHNHMRMWVAMMATSVARAHWYTMSKWMYYHLLDGDIASNSLSWQWVAGTSRLKPYVANQELINACSDSVQTQTFLDMPRENIGTGSIPQILKNTHIQILETPLPEGDEITIERGQTIALYHAWHIDPTWRLKESIDQRIFVIEPSCFKKFPVSQKVIDFIITLAKSLIPDIQIYIGEVTDLLGINQASQIYTREHPCIKHFPGTHDTRPLLFPGIPKKYYPSFSGYWKQIEKIYF